jgi:hypothetical protein
VFKNPRIIAKSIAVQKSLISNPGTNLSVINNASEFNRSATIKYIYVKAK